MQRNYVHHRACRKSRVAVNIPKRAHTFVVGTSGVDLVGVSPRRVVYPRERNVRVRQIDRRARFVFYRVRVRVCVDELSPGPVEEWHRTSGAVVFETSLFVCHKFNVS